MTVEYPMDLDGGPSNLEEDRVGLHDDEAISESFEALVLGMWGSGKTLPERLDRVEEPSKEAPGRAGPIPLDVAANLVEILDGPPEEADSHRHFRSCRRTAATPIPRSPARTSASASSRRA
jgi:hypothetical protein